MCKFYNIDFEYLAFLKEREPKVPNFECEEHDKFFFGVVLNINGINYYVPVSSKKWKNQTSMLMKDYSDNPAKPARELGSLRFGYMLPAPDNMLSELDFTWLRLTKGSNYSDLVAREYDFCKKNIDRIMRRAKRVYYFGTNEESPLYQYCCKFKLLESSLDDWSVQHT